MSKYMVGRGWTMMRSRLDLLAPALVLLGIFSLADRLPFTFFTAGSFTSAGTYCGFEKLLAFTISPDFWQVLGNTAYFPLQTVIPSLVLL